VCSLQNVFSSKVTRERALRNDLAASDFNSKSFFLFARRIKLG
jgi:hypothetical protein